MIKKNFVVKEDKCQLKSNERPFFLHVCWIVFFFSLFFQNHDVECVKAHAVQSQVLVPEKLPVSNIQGEVLEILLDLS